MIQQMYIGPTIPGIAKKGTIYIGKLPERILCAMEKLPEMGHLIVPIEQITKAIGALHEQGSIEDISFTRTVRYFNNEIK